MSEPIQDRSIPTDASIERGSLLGAMAKRFPSVEEVSTSSQGFWKEFFPEIIGCSKVMADILVNVAKIAKSDSSVLILGESGTGKELIASAIHRLSSRSHRAFVAINCSAIPEELLEAELFGHEKGAFTGADRKRPGHFGIADGGTLFLDEIGDMPMRLQAKLLRVIQEKKFSPVGSSDLKSADVRFIAATNKNLELEVQEKTFRLDLYYRLNVLPIQLPSLKMRTEDIPLLAEHFLTHLNRVHTDRSTVWFSRKCLDRLASYEWPGNVRQLQNLVERLFIMSNSNEILAEDLPTDLRTKTKEAHQTEAHQTEAHHQLNLGHPDQLSLPSEPFDLTKYIEDLENLIITKTLQRTGNNKNQAAKLLGLNRTTLVERLKKRGIS